MVYDFNKLVAISQEKRSSISVRTNRTWENFYNNFNHIMDILHSNQNNFNNKKALNHNDGQLSLFVCHVVIAFDQS